MSKAKRVAKAARRAGLWNESALERDGSGRFAKEQGAWLGRKHPRGPGGRFRPTPDSPELPREDPGAAWDRKASALRSILARPGVHQNPELLARVGEVVRHEVGRRLSSAPTSGGLMAERDALIAGAKHADAYAYSEVAHEAGIRSGVERLSQDAWRQAARETWQEVDYLDGVLAEHRRGHMVDVLGTLTSMGGQLRAETDGRHPSQSPGIAMIAGHMPTAWINASNSGSGGTMKPLKVVDHDESLTNARGQYDYVSGTISLAPHDDDDDDSTALHEFGHRMQTHPMIADAESRVLHNRLKALDDRMGRHGETENHLGPYWNLELIDAGGMSFMGRRVVVNGKARDYYPFQEPQTARSMSANYSARVYNDGIGISKSLVRAAKSIGLGSPVHPASRVPGEVLTRAIDFAFSGPPLPRQYSGPYRNGKGGTDARVKDERNQWFLGDWALGLMATPLKDPLHQAALSMADRSPARLRP